MAFLSVILNVQQDLVNTFNTIPYHNSFFFNYYFTILNFPTKFRDDHTSVTPSRIVFFFIIQCNALTHISFGFTIIERHSKHTRARHSFFEFGKNHVSRHFFFFFFVLFEKKRTRVEITFSYC